MDIRSEFFQNSLDNNIKKRYNVYNVYIHYEVQHSMNILISNSSGEPIYEQIAAQIKAMRLKGELSAGDALPSMRLLAGQLRISVITTKRAYEELERDGFIESYTGKGSFVRAQNAELIREETLRTIEELMGQICEKARLCDVSLEELKDTLEIIYKE